MLVLGRKGGERIIVRTDNRVLAVITVLKGTGGKKQVRIGLDADNDIYIERFEIASPEVQAQALQYTFEGKLQEKLQPTQTIVAPTGENADVQTK